MNYDGHNSRFGRAQPAKQVLRLVDVEFHTCTCGYASAGVRWGLLGGKPALRVTLLRNYPIATLTRLEVNGISRTRAPVAAKIAFAIAAAVVTVDGSPAPTAG